MVVGYHHFRKPPYVNHMFFALLSSLSLTALDSHHASYAPCPRHARSIYVGLQQMTVAMRQGWGNGTQKRWWFQIFVIFTPNPGEMIQFDSYFSNGWFNHQAAKAFSLGTMKNLQRLATKLTPMSLSSASGRVAMCGKGQDLRSQWQQLHL